MSIYERILFIGFLFTTSTFADTVVFSKKFSVQADPKLALTEVFYDLSHAIDCGGSNGTGDLPGLLGEIKLSQPDTATIRFEVFEGKDTTRIALGTAEAGAVGEITIIQPPGSPPCKNIETINGNVVTIDTTGAEKVLTKFNGLDPKKNTAQWKQFEKDIFPLALRYTPVVNVRKSKAEHEQYTDRLTDLPLEPAYSIHSHAPNTISIRYTWYISDEDSQVTEEDVLGQMERYDRPHDIEWVYEVTFDTTNGNLLSTQYQGDIKRKTLKTLAGDHATLSFVGNLWPHSQHPILYTIKNNNVFSHKDPDAGMPYVAYHLGLSPESLIPYPEAREDLLLTSKGAYTYLVSEREMVRENKMPKMSKGKKIATFDNYLMISVDGVLKPDDTMFNANNGAITAHGIYFTKPGASAETDLLRFHTTRSNDRLGEDTHRRKSKMAMRVDRDFLALLDHRKAGMLVYFSDKRRYGETEEFIIKDVDAFHLVWNKDSHRYETKMLRSQLRDVYKNKSNRLFTAEFYINPEVLPTDNFELSQIRHRLDPK